MSLDITLSVGEENLEYVYEANITHNLSKMASEAGIYYALWRPEELGVCKASQLIEVIEKGLHELVSRPTHYKQFDASNGWGTYEDFVPFVAKYLEACKQYPDAWVGASR